MEGIEMKSTGRYIPPVRVTNDQFASIVDTSDEWITTRTGVKSRNFAQEEHTTQMALRAAQRAIESGNIDKENIGVVVVATFTSEYLTPSAACMLQKELGLPEAVLAFDINAACSGFLYALHVARSLLCTMPGKYALVVGCETLSKLTDFTDRSTCVLFGDGAGAVIVAAKQGAPYFFCAGAQGGADALCVKGLQNKQTPFVKGVTEQPPHHIEMDGKEVFRFAVDAIQKSVHNVLEQAGLCTEDIDYYVCHQANTRILTSAAKRLDVPSERFFSNLAHMGNTSAASIPIALDEMNEQGLLKRGSKLILAGFGGGLTYGATYFNW